MHCSKCGSPNIFQGYDRIMGRKYEYCEMCSTEVPGSSQTTKLARQRPVIRTKEEIQSLSKPMKERALALEYWALNPRTVEAVKELAKRYGIGATTAWQWAGKHKPKEAL